MASKVAVLNEIDLNLAQSLLKYLVDVHLFKYSFAVKCPECGLLLCSTDSVTDIDREIYCYNCEEMFSISPDDVEVVYIFDNYPFVNGQQSQAKNGLEESAALHTDSLTQLLKSGGLDLNSIFFSPTEAQYSDLQTQYFNIFNMQKNTKATGDTLECLTINLFSLCKHFRAVPIRLKPNQIDCYVRNKLYIPGITQANCIDSFEIECKNESRPPKAGYLNKLHSILGLSGKNFGIIISKCLAPKTINTLANQIYLKDKIIIIAIDKNDLSSIILDKKNLLEIIECKIETVKLNATQDLRSIGLYDS